MIDAKCDIIIPVFNQYYLTKDCLDSIRKHTRTPHRIILIDNASSSQTRNYLERYTSSSDNIILYRNDENVGWVKAVNQGIGHSVSPYVCIMNNDTLVETEAWLTKLVKIADSSDEIGLVNPRFDDKLSKKPARNRSPYIEIDFCRGYCMLVKRTVIDKIGGLDEAYGLGYYDDDDFSVRAIRAGFRCVKVDDVVVRHLRDSTFSKIFADEKRRSLHQANKELFYSKWGRRLRIMVVISGKSDRNTTIDTLLALARHQHVIYLWNGSHALEVEHINLREKSCAASLLSVSCALDVLFNMMKNRAKRYDLVFTDDDTIYSILAGTSSFMRGRTPIYNFSFDKDQSQILSVAESISKVPV